MQNHIKGGLKIFFDYFIALILFVIFLYPFIALTKDNFLKWLPYFSLFLFFLLSLIIYSDMKDLAIREKRPQYTGLMPYPWKGIVLGLIGFLPIIIIEIIFKTITFGEFFEIIKPVLLNGILGPVYFLLALFGEGILGYIFANLAIPVVALLGYLAGYYDIDLGVEYKKLKSKLPKLPKFED